MYIVKYDNSFLDTEIALNAEYRHDASDTVILLGGWKLCRKHDVAWYKKNYRKVIVFNQEQIVNPDKNYMSFEYFKMLRDADEVWDYDEFNLHALNSIRNDIKLHFLKPCKELDAGTGEKTIDVLFYGVVNDRRRRILDKLKADGINVTVIEQVFGDDLVPYIRSAKIRLNLHKHDTGLQEQARMIRWISSKATILSEASRLNYLHVNETDEPLLYSKLHDILEKDISV